MQNTGGFQDKRNDLRQRPINIAPQHLGCVRAGADGRRLGFQHFSQTFPVRTVVSMPEFPRFCRQPGEIGRPCRSDRIAKFKRVALVVARFLHVANRR
jgi:hypothetical protein